MRHQNEVNAFARGAAAMREQHRAFLMDLADENAKLDATRPGGEGVLTHMLRQMATTVSTLPLPEFDEA